MKLSIIIPVYNVGKYLQRCLESIFEQNFSAQDYEVILINDGSTDNSKEIISLFEQSHTNLIAIHQDNRGVSHSRNKGLSIAKGDFITFIDGDDAIYPNTLQPIVNLMEADQLDILYLKIESYTEDGQQLPYDYKVGADGVIKDGFTHQRRTFPATLYLKKIIGSNKFVEDIVIGEDTVFNAIVQSNALRCSYYSLPYYKYTFRNNSSSKLGKSYNAYLGFLKGIKTLGNYKNDTVKNASNLQNNYFDSVISIFIIRIIDLHILPNLDKKKYIELKNTLTTLELSYLSSVSTSDSHFLGYNFFLFSTYHRIKNLKQKIFLIAYRTKKKLFKNLAT